MSHPQALTLKPCCTAWGGNGNGNGQFGQELAEAKPPNPASSGVLAKPWDRVGAGRKRVPAGPGKPAEGLVTFTLGT